MNRPSVPNFETVWRLARVKVKGDYRLRELNRIESGIGWNQAVWNRSHACAGDRGDGQASSIDMTDVTVQDLGATASTGLWSEVAVGRLQAPR